MKIQDKVIEPYEIWQDNHNFVVGIPYTNPKTGEINLNNASYFTSLSNALLKVAGLKMIKEEQKVVNLNEYIKKYESIKNEILNTIKL